MFFDELVAADKRISRIRALPLHRRGALLDAYRENNDLVGMDAIIEAVEVDVNFWIFA